MRMLVHPYQKSLYQFEGKFHAYLHAKNQLHSTCFWRHFNKTANLLILVIWVWLITPT